jgi:hypothetical protein
MGLKKIYTSITKGVGKYNREFLKIAHFYFFVYIREKIMKNLYLILFVSLFGNTFGQSLSSKLDDYTWIATAGSVTA